LIFRRWSAALEELQREHRALDEEVRALTMCGVVDQLKVMRLKRRKLTLKDEILPDRGHPQSGHHRLK
jgi:hypothetical protein